MIHTAQFIWLHPPLQPHYPASFPSLSRLQPHWPAFYPSACPRAFALASSSHAWNALSKFFMGLALSFKSPLKSHPNRGVLMPRPQHHTCAHTHTHVYIHAHTNIFTSPLECQLGKGEDPYLEESRQDSLHSLPGSPSLGLGGSRLG